MNRIEKTNPLLVFATYWNEIDWIRASLIQIENLNPREVLICDGCFDPSYPQRSTDGTREVIEETIKDHPHWRLFDSVQVSRNQAPLALLKNIPLFNNKYTPINLFTSLRKGLSTNLYRINQALTFANMIKKAKHWIPGNWFMTIDADQFYPDEMIDKFSQIMKTPGNIGLITAKELTFFDGFNRNVTGYEKRTYNNMPHRIFPDTQIFPTRFFKRNSFWSSKLYIDSVESISVGYYHHYRFRKGNREALTYQLGDRKPPKQSRFSNSKPFKGELPLAIRSYINNYVSQ